MNGDKEMSAEKVTNLKSIWDSAKKNIQTLDNCAGPHDFEPIANPTNAKKFRCKLCGGDVDADGNYWYEKGLAHGREN
jgi:hypothetical protein